VDFDALREVIEDDEGPSRGASTITMQTVKNVYLWHGPSYVRKTIEIPLALVVDTLWGKRRVMEVYLNVAEWGPGVFGAEAAARRYFNVSAAQLTPAQAARLAAALPNPVARTPARPSRFASRVAARMGDGKALAGCVNR
jgi:monofunctional biosynthetic peptidoglycan transglycosylase